MKLLNLGLVFLAIAVGALRAQTAPTVASLTNSQTKVQGDSISLSVSVNGTAPFTYQWKKGGADIARATASTYGINALATTDAGSYTVVVTNGAGSITAGPILIDVTPATAPTFNYPPGNLTYTVGDTINFYASVSGTSPLTFVWYKGTTEIATITSYSYSKANAQASDTGTYHVKVTNVAGTVTSPDFTVTVNPLAAPVLSGPSSTTVDTGNSFWLSAWVNNSSGVTFQWYKDGVAIAGATSSSYSVNSATASDAGAYTIKATNSAGTTTSAVATVTVRPAVAPSGVSITTGPITASVNESFNLYASSNGTSPLSYQWRKDGVNIVGATSSSYYKSGVTVNDSGTYSVVVTNSVGSATSSGTVVSVTSAQAPIITRHPTSVAVYPGSYVSLSVSASGTGQLAYEWKKDGVSIPGATWSYFTVTSSATTADAGSYTVVVTGSQGSVTSQPAVVTVMPAVAPTITVQPASTSIQPGQSLSLNVTATGRPYPTYQWKKDGVAIAGATNSNYSKSNAASSDSASYTVAVSNTAGSVTSAAATVTVGVAVPPEITSHPASASLLPGEYFSGLSVGVPWSMAYTVTYQWYRNGVEIPNATNSTYSISGAQPAHVGTYKVVVTNASGSTTSNESEITVDLTSARPVITYTPGGSAVAGGNSAYLNISLAPNLGTTTVAWKKDGVVVPNATGTSLTLGMFTASMAGSYTAEVTTTTGTYTSRPIPLRLLDAGRSPRITVQPASVGTTIASSAYFSVQADGEQPLTYQWYKGPTAIPGATYSNYSLYSLTAAHAGSYSVEVRNANGATTSDVATLTVTTTASGAPVFAENPASQTLTEGTYGFSLSSSLLNGIGGETFQWYKNGTAILSATSSSYYINSVTTAVAGRYTVIATNGVGATTSAEAVVTVTTRATGPTFTTQPANQTGFAGGSATFTAAATGGTVTYQWRKDGAVITGATGATLSLTGLVAADAGNYTVLASNADGTTASSVAVLTVNASIAPVFTVNPVAVNALFGGSATFTAAASGEPAPTYQWKRNDVAVPGATAATLTLTNLQAPDAGTYSVVATNVAGAATSVGARLALFTELPMPPSITMQPQSVGRPVGGTARFAIGVAGTAPLSVQWYKDGTAISGAKSTTLLLTEIKRADIGTYHAVVTNAYGQVESSGATLAIGTSTVTHVYFGTFSSGGSWALASYQDGTGVFLAQLSGAGQAIVARNVVLAGDGSFSFGADTQSMQESPAIGDQPIRSAVTVASHLFTGPVSGRIVGGNVTGQLGGTSATLAGSERSGTTSAAVAGWYDAVPLGSGMGEIHALAAPDGTCLLVQIDAAGVRGATGTVTSGGAFSVSTTGSTYTGTLSAGSGILTGTCATTGGASILLAAPPSSGNGTERLMNVSTRALAGTDSETLIVGFVISGNSPKDVMVRALGPTLASLGVTGSLADPRIKVFKGSATVLENDNWSTNTNAAAMLETATRLGATPVPTGSADAGVLARVAPGVYTAHVSANGATGVALMEVYDAAVVEAGGPRVVNLSARSRVGRGDDILIIGFVIDGQAPKRVLVRGLGPTLATAGVVGALNDPKLKLFHQSTILSENDDWGTSADAAEIAAAGRQVGAGTLADGSKDSALLVYLAPGVYSAHVSGVGDTVGVGLVEVYEVP